MEGKRKPPSPKNDNMKQMNLVLILLISLFGACEKPDTTVPTTPTVVEQDTILDMQWVTRMDFEKEIVNLANGVLYDDWYIRSGDKDDPSKIMAFHKISGEKEWELVLDLDGYDIIRMHTFENLLLATNHYHVFAIDLSTRQLLWNVRLRSMGTRVGTVSLASNNKLYVKADFSFGTAGQVLHIYEFDPYTGENRMVYSKPPDSTGIYSCSPPAVWFDPALGKDILVFNLYPDSFAPPQDGEQYLVGVDPDDRYTELFRIPVVDKFSSNGGHPPLIFNNSVITGGWTSIFCFDLITKVRRWKYTLTTNDPFASWSNTHHLMHDNRLYVNETGFNVTCLNPYNGIALWNNPTGGPNSTENMVYYAKEDLLVFTSWGYGSVMVLDGLTGQTIHREREYDYSSYNNDVVYDEELDMFFTSTYKHAMGFTIKRPK